VIDGHDLLLDEGDSLALAGGIYEPEEKAWYERTVRPGDFVVEVGANLGYFSLVFGRAVGPKGRVVSYEPDPDVGQILRRNAAVNGYSNLEVRPVAVADQTGTMTFYRDPKTTGDNRLFSHGHDRDSFSVPVVTLDENLAEFSERIDLVKMDIQGAEPLALDGMERLLQERPPRRMLIEFWPHGIAGMGRDPARMIDVLRAAGYHLTRLDDHTEFELGRALREMTPENKDWVNLICVHETADAHE
jgi:FkbM family methyltransferase